MDIQLGSHEISVISVFLSLLSFISILYHTQQIILTKHAKYPTTYKNKQLKGPIFQFFIFLQIGGRRNSLDTRQHHVCCNTVLSHQIHILIHTLC